MKVWVLGILSLSWFGVASAQSNIQETCLGSNLDDSVVRQLIDSDFDLPEDYDPHALALNMQACLGSEDPVLRDKFAYTGLSALLRRQLINESKRLTLLRLALDDFETDSKGMVSLQNSFSGLLIAELARGRSH